MSYIIFENPGQLDDRALFVLGMNAKLDASAIGTFGTGLKYSIAVLVRMGCKIFIQPGDGREYPIELSHTNYRSKDFSIPQYKGRDLPFTLDYGKNWKPWMVYRELRSNAQDERGHVYIAPSHNIVPEYDQVRIIVKSDELCDIHSKPDSIFFNQRYASKLSEFVWVSDAFPGTLFYRGIRVATLTEPCPYSFNILSVLPLTEDRTLDSSGLWEAGYMISLGIEQVSVNRSGHEEIVSEALCPKHDEYFATIPRIQLPEGSVGFEIARRIYRTNPTDLRPDYLELMRKHFNENQFTSRNLLSSDKEVIAQVKATMSRIGLPITDLPIVWNADLGEKLFGCVKDGKIYIGYRAFEEGYRNVLATVLEERLHYVEKVRDYTREFQDWTLRLIVRLTEELNDVENRG